MSEINQEHLKILGDKSRTPVNYITENIIVYFHYEDCLAAMKVLQDRIDTLRALINFCECDDPQFHHNDTTTCARCNKPFDVELS